MSLAKLGKPQSPEGVKKRSGSNHYRWIGGKEFYQRDYLRRLRKSVMESLGGKCVVCGFTDTRALQIDHINGGGSKERKERGFSGSFHKNVLNSFLNGEAKYQLLCANCNWIKRYENKEAKGPMKT